MIFNQWIERHLHILRVNEIQTSIKYVAAEWGFQTNFTWKLGMNDLNLRE